MSHKVTPKQLEAISLLVAGMSATKVAKELGLRRETLSRWKRQPWFHELYESVRQEMTARLKHQWLGLAEKAVSRLHDAFYGFPFDPKRLEVMLKVIETLKITPEVLGKPPDTLPNPPESSQ